MGRTRIPAGWTAPMWALVLSAVLGCGGGSSPAPPPVEPPAPADRGTPVETSSALKIIGATGGFVTSSDGVLTVTVPAGALSTDIDLTIQVITNTAPSAAGNAYRIAIVPADTELAAPIALVFSPDSSTSLADLGVATQDANGFWVRQQSVTRDATAGTLTVTTTSLGDWAVVGLPTGRDLIGVYHVESTTSVPVTADGKSSLNFHAGDATTGWYVQAGQFTAQSPLTVGGQTCTPDAPTMSLAPNVTEILASPDRFRWGVDGQWDLTCSPSGTSFAYVSFDTTGLGYLSCTRSYLETPLISPEKLLGRYRIDCGTGGTITASWQFEICNLGELCPSPNPCHTASITCDTGLPLCVDDGNVQNGLSCDLVPSVNEVCGDGVCNVCRIGETCTPAAPDVCHVGTYTCDTGFEVCTDSGAFIPNGTTCDLVAGADEVCGNGTCNVCTAGMACATNPNPCVAGTTSCTTGFETCIDTANPIAAGTVCDLTPLVDEVCNGTGTCIACTAGLACASNSNVCVAGVTSCHTGGETCENTTTPVRTGLVCDVIPLVDEVCFNGACNACTAGTLCAANPNECVQGVTSCTTGQELCVDTSTPIRTGLVCDENPLVDEVCNAGVCNACTANAACTYNSNACFTGVTSCMTGVETCENQTQLANGTICGTNLVCFEGACSACTSSLACSYNSNPCVAGTTSCSTGRETCENTATPITAGATCDVIPLVDEVCNGTGTCTACTASQACSYNSNPCVAGTTSCATGGETCENTATPIAAGAACDVNPLADEVCNGAGACVGCAASQACSYNSNPCVAGTTSCATGGETCENTATPIAAGTTCDVAAGDEVCNGTGACIACTANLSCTSNSNVCYSGVTSCATGGETCENAAPLANGTSCGTNQVCNGGGCSACTANVSCSYNTNPCVAGTTSCATGTETCEDTATQIANGTTCGTDQVCNGGVCSACVAGVACTDDPDPCLTGLTSCTTGTRQCVSTATPEPNGTSCGTDQVCNGGVCSACTAGLACEGNPTSCLVGTTSCLTGISTCIDTATPEPVGTSCGTDQVCSGSGVCNACVSGADCTAFGACTQSLTSCATGKQECVDTFSPIANGTICGTDQVCSGGVCSFCSAGDACAYNPNACLEGVTSCDTGVETCDDTTTQIANGTNCGPDQVCNAGVCSACAEGGTCTGNPNECVQGTFSCATGTQACVDTASAFPDGSSCGTDQVCNAGVCLTCVAGGSCTTNPNSPCTAGIVSCTVPGSEGTQVCIDDPAITLPNGTGCGTDQVCNGGLCSACIAGVACTDNPDPCFTGVTSCTTGTSVCVDSATAEPNGTSCGTDAVCSGGLCSACVSGGTCATNPNPCVAGTFSCATGTQTCIDTATQIANGTTCGTDQVCSGGACVACVADAACGPNPDPCRTGVTSCAAGTQQCLDTAVLEPDGTSCGTDLVCSGGACVACVAGASCDTNPNACVLGTTSCATGTSICVDTATPKPAGIECGTGQVCSGTGVCNACVAGLDCTIAGACTQSVTSCDSGAQTCVETGIPLADGTACGTNQVCDEGLCGACTAGTACSYNANACLQGVTSCATGAETCLDTATPLANGTGCGTDLVCSAGSCVSCVAGATCLTNADPCRTGVTSCSTGTSSCVDSPTAEPDGTVCGADQVCDDGSCVSCTAGIACDPGATSCVTGTTSCSTGTSTCVETAIPKANGAVCGADQVCSGGACVACVAGGACDTNPNPCVAGTFSCATGAQECVDTLVLEPDGTSCGTNYVCSGGACTACVAGVECTPTNACTVHRTSCETGSSVCEDTGTPVADGTVCGTNQVCDGGVCTACTPGAACTTNPSTCLAGTTSCATGESCLDTATPLANGTTCGTDHVCNAGSCVACTAGVACDTNPDACHTGTTSCATGTSVCVDSPTTEPNGTVCGTNQVCNGGACIACVAGAACQNPGSCFAATTSCDSGSSVCVDGAVPLPEGTSCGASSICNASGGCISVRTVSGSRKASYWTTTGTCSAAVPCKDTVVAPDVLFSPYAAVSARPAAGGTWAEIPGTFSGDGSFLIPDVPTGPYQLVLVDGRGVTHVVETSSSSVDLGYDVLGRSDAQAATSPTLVTFDLTGLTPWLAEDEVEATAFDVDVFDVPVAGADVLSGQTTGGAVEDWGTSSVGRALNLLAGTDVLHLHQLSTETATDGVNAFAYQRATVTAAHVGQPTTLTAALAPTIDSGTVTVSWDPEAFEALLSALGPSPAPVPNPHRLLVEVSPYASLSAAPIAAYGTPQLFRMVRAHGGPDVLAPISLAPITYGRFLDVQLASDWRRAEFAATVSYAVSGASPLDVVASVGRRDRMSPAPPTPIAPAVGPVQSPLVAGASALGTIPAPGVTPTVSWSAPAIGTPTRYEVRLHRLEAPAGATVASLVAAWQLTGTSLTVPAGLLQPGATYFAEITAYLVADERFDVAPLRRAHVFSHATTLTSPFTP